MSDLHWLRDEQVARLQPFFPKSHGRPRVDDRRVLSGIIFVSRNGLRWRDAPADDGPPKTLYNRWRRWSGMGVFARMMAGLGGGGGCPEDCDDRRHHPQGAPHGLEPAVEKGGSAAQKGRLIGRTKGGLDTKLHAVTDAEGRPIRSFPSAGQVSDHTGALAPLGALPKADWLLADRGHDADWFREALADKGIKPCIPGRRSRERPIRHDKRRYKRRHRIEMMFGRPKDWRRGATRLTTDAPRSSSQPSPPPPPSCSGYES